ncbi:hypothetical protein CFREI_02030 [Corynebacterium freiburgense]|nr:hypothetical protein CFREI_02030 [Corynebacterium freiburgense]
MALQINQFRQVPVVALLGVAFVAFLGTVCAWVWLTKVGPDPMFPTFMGIFFCLIALVSVVLLGRVWHALVQLSPTALLMTVFPFIVDEIRGVIALVLMVSVTVPWISHAVTLPFYRPLQEVSRENELEFNFQFMRLCPAILAYSLIPLLGFGVVMATINTWWFFEVGVYLLGLFTNLLFALAMIPAQELRKPNFIFAGWACYAFFLLLFPHFWFFAPLAGIVPHLALIGGGLQGVLDPAHPGKDTIFWDLGLGLLFGSILWSDKFFLIALYSREVDVVTVYVGLIPVVVGMAVFFSSQYPLIRKNVDSLMLGIHQIPLSGLRRSVDLARNNVARCFALTLSVASVSALGVLLVSASLNIEHDFLSLLLFIVPIPLLAFHLSVFQLTQFYMHGLAALYSGVFLVIVLVAFLFIGAVAGLLTAALVAVIGSVVAIRSASNRMKDAPFEMFWQKAVNW